MSSIFDISKSESTSAKGRRSARWEKVTFTLDQFLALKGLIGHEISRISVVTTVLICEITIIKISFKGNLCPKSFSPLTKNNKLYYPFNTLNI